jgi:hypothetical protein
MPHLPESMLPTMGELISVLAKNLEKSSEFNPKVMAQHVAKIFCLAAKPLFCRETILFCRKTVVLSQNHCFFANHCFVAKPFRFVATTILFSGL